MKLLNISQSVNRDDNQTKFDKGQGLGSLRRSNWRYNFQLNGTRQNAVWDDITLYPFPECHLAEFCNTNLGLML
jgi:hypothetical protein